MSLGGLYPKTVSHPPGEVARVVLVQHLTNAFVQEIVVVAGDGALGYEHDHLRQFLQLCLVTYGVGSVPANREVL